jgi:hypothetical protein
MVCGRRAGAEALGAAPSDAGGALMGGGKVEPILGKGGKLLGPRRAEWGSADPVM